MHGSKVMLCTFSRYHAYKVKMKNFQRAILQKKNFRIFFFFFFFFFFFKLIRSSTHQSISLLDFKAIASIVLDILLTSLKCQNLQRVVTQEKKIYLEVNQVIYSSFPISLSGFKQFSRYLAYKVKMPKFSKGYNS